MIYNNQNVNSYIEMNSRRDKYYYSSEDNSETTVLRIAAAPTPIFRQYKDRRRKIIIPRLHPEITSYSDEIKREEDDIRNTETDDESNKTRTSDSSTISTNIVKRRRPPGQVYPFNCDVCGLGFMVKESVTAHKRRKHGSCKYICELCNVGFSMQRELASHYNVHRELDGYHCMICPKIFPLIASFLRHRKTHVMPKNFVCSVCGNKFRTNGELKSHSALHSSMRRYSCDICNQGFNAQKLLTDHMNSHTGDRPYVCECGKSFKTTSALTNHKKIHMDPDLRPFKCDYCDMKFITNSVRRKHMRTHTGEKTHKCADCDMVLSCASSLLKHRRAHTGDRPYECDVCHKRFTTHQKLRVHRYVHSGIKPFKCKHCSASFSQALRLERHKQIHNKPNEKKVFRCEPCNFNFGIEGKFIEHLAMHSNEFRRLNRIKLMNGSDAVVSKRKHPRRNFRDSLSDGTDEESDGEFSYMKPSTMFVDVKTEPTDDESGSENVKYDIDPLSATDTILIKQEISSESEICSS